MDVSVNQYSFRFVCQGGGLDVKAAFLAASLKENLRCSYELIACVPSDESVSAPQDGVIDFLQEIGATIESIKNPLAEDYPIGNKLACLALTTNCNKRVFLDSDILCLRPFHGFPEADPYVISAKLEDWNHHSDLEWQDLYSYLGLGKPGKSFYSTVFNEAMPLYFNAGVLVVDNKADLIERWINIANDVDENTSLPRKRPNLDQLTLAVLVVKYDYKWQLLDESYNYPAELRSVNPSFLPYFCHYHDPLMVLSDAYLSGTVARLCLKHKELQSIAQHQADWVWQLAAGEVVKPMFR